MVLKNISSHIPENISSVSKGVAAEVFFKMILSLNGIAYSPPPDPNSRYDILVEPRPRKFLRCQVKVIEKNGAVPLRWGSSRGNKRFTYTSEDIDFMIGIDMNTFDYYIISMKYLEDNGYKRSISVKILSDLGKKNNLSFFE